MKLQYLVAIFLIIFLPLSIVLSIYIDNLVDVVDREAEISKALLNATYDAVKAYQMNTINENFSRSEATEMRDLYASKNTLLNSLQTELFNSGYGKEIITDYIPAMLFNLYDGYYLYGASNNIAIETEDENKKTHITYSNTVLNDDSLQDFNISNKRYYTCRYVGNVPTTINDDFNKKHIKSYDLSISYTLDNYIRVYGTYTADKTYFVNAAGYYDYDTHKESFKKERLTEKIQYYDEKNIIEDKRTTGRYIPEVGEPEQVKSLNRYGDNADFHFIDTNFYFGSDRLEKKIVDGKTVYSNLINNYYSKIQGAISKATDKGITNLVGAIFLDDGRAVGTEINGNADYISEDEKLEKLITESGWKKPYQEGEFDYVIYNGVKYYLDTDAKHGYKTNPTKEFNTFSEFKKNAVYYEYYRKKDGKMIKDYRFIYVGNGDGTAGNPVIYDDNNYIIVAKKNSYDATVRSDNLSFNKTYSGIPIFRLANNKRQYINNTEATEIANYLGIGSVEDLCKKENFLDNNADKYFDANVTGFTSKIRDILKVINVDDAESISYNLNYSTILANGEKIPASDEYSVSHSKYKYKENNIKKDERYIFNLDMEYENSTNTGKNDPLLKSSPFDRHRKDVIIANLEYSLNVAMQSFNDMYGTTYIYTLPKMTEMDFENMTESINFVVFFQGMTIGGYKYYNNYALVTDTISKEYIGKQDVFLHYTDDYFNYLYPSPTQATERQKFKDSVDKAHLANCSTLIHESLYNQYISNSSVLNTIETKSRTWLIGYSAFEYERDYCDVPLSNDVGSPYSFSPIAYYYPQSQLKCYDCLVLKNGVMGKEGEKADLDEILASGINENAIKNLYSDSSLNTDQKKEKFCHIILGRTLRKALARYKQTTNNSNIRCEIKPVN